MLILLTTDFKGSSFISDHCELKANIVQARIITVRNSYSTIYSGVPQVSVLGPILFTLNTAPLSQVIARYDVEHHLCAYDTQISISLSGSEALESLTDFKSCVTDVFTWMTNSKLKLNPGKTEFIIIGSIKQREKFEDLFPTLKDCSRYKIVWHM